MGVTLQWPAQADITDKFLLDSRRRFEDLFHEVFAQRVTGWIAKVVKEEVTGITVQFSRFDGKPCGPAIFFSGMVDVRDVENLTTFLPWP